MTREELKKHREKQIEMCELWANGKGEKPGGKVYEEHKLILELLEQEPKTGHWIEYSWNDNGLARWGLECDKCHKKYKYGGEIWNNPNFCPNCGIKMVEPQENEG